MARAAGWLGGWAVGRPLQRRGRAFAEACAGRHRSALLLFIDVSKAFDQAVREFLEAQPETTELEAARRYPKGFQELSTLQLGRLPEPQEPPT